MTTSALLSTEQQRDTMMVERACVEPEFTILKIVRPGRLRWVGPWLPKLPLGWQDLWRELRPRKFRWGWALLLAIVLLLLVGELSPSASAIALLLR